MRPAATAFEVSTGALARLARTRHAPEAAALLRAGLYSRRLVLLKALLAMAEQPRAVSPGARQRLRRHWRLLEQAEERDSGAVRAVLSYPAVGNWLVHALNTPAGQHFEEALAGLGAIAVSAALRARLAFHVTLPTRAGRLTLPGIGAYEARTPLVRIAAGPRSLRLVPEGRRTGVLLLRPYAGAVGAGWRGLHPLAGGGAVLDGLDPYRAGPRGADDGTGPFDGCVDAPSAGFPVGPSGEPRSGSPCPTPAHGSAWSGGTAARIWQARWCGALSLLTSADPQRAAEVTSLVRSVVPLEARRPAGGTSSATRRAAPWAVLTTLPGSAHELAEVLVHEVQHSKLAVLSDLVALHHADGRHGGGAARYRVPWRADPRPFEAALQGTYAHLALADLWHRIAGRGSCTATARDAARARARCERYRDQVGHALPLLLGSGHLTCAGREFAEGMREHLESLGRRDTPVALADYMLSNGDIR